MMRVMLTGLQYADIDKVKECVCVGNAVHIVREPEFDKEEKAYKAICKGVKIGYIPCVETIRGYYKASNHDAHRSDLATWGRATKAIREWLESRERYQMEDEWVVRVAEITYDYDYNTVGDNYNTVGKGELQQISVNFEDVL